jgi:hypothetical protein
MFLFLIIIIISNRITLIPVSLKESFVALLLNLKVFNYGMAGKLIALILSSSKYEESRQLPFSCAAVK